MLINLRNALMAGKRKPTAKDYVQDGLVAMWDGIENAGWGVHDSNATTWKNLAGGGDSIISSNASWSRLSLDGNGTGYMATMPENIAALTIECVFVNTRPQLNYYGDCLYNIHLGNLYRGYAILSARNGAEIEFSGWSTGNGAVKLGNVNSAVCNRAMYAAATFTTTTSTQSVSSIYIDGIAATRISNDNGMVVGQALIGGQSLTSDTRAFKGSIYCLRFHSRALTASEIARNYNIDKARFNLP